MGENTRHRMSVEIIRVFTPQLYMEWIMSHLPMRQLSPSMEAAQLYSSCSISANANPTTPWPYKTFILIKALKISWQSKSLLSLSSYHHRQHNKCESKRLDFLLNSFI